MMNESLVSHPMDEIDLPDLHSPETNFKENEQRERDRDIFRIGVCKI